MIMDMDIIEDICHLLLGDQFMFAPPRDPYHPVWIQHPSYRPKHNGFGNIRKDIRVPGRVDSRPIYSKNKNFGGRR